MTMQSSNRNDLTPLEASYLAFQERNAPALHLWRGVFPSEIIITAGGRGEYVCKGVYESF